MTEDREPYVKRVVDLENGDETQDFGKVTHREGRKVWFENTIFTFSSVDDLVILTTKAPD